MDRRQVAGWAGLAALVTLTIAGTGALLQGSDAWQREHRPVEFWTRRVSEEKAVLESLSLEVRLAAHDFKSDAAERGRDQEEMAILLTAAPDGPDKAALLRTTAEAEVEIRKGQARAFVHDIGALREQEILARKRLAEAEAELARWKPAR